MVKRTLEYWLDDGWCVGRLKEVPGVFSQGATLEELEDNLQEAYRLMLEEGASQDHPPAATKEVVLDVA